MKPTWSDAFRCEPEFLIDAVAKVRAARRELEQSISEISSCREEADFADEPAARWHRQERLRQQYEDGCKAVARAEVELIVAVMGAARDSALRQHETEVPSQH